MMRNRFLTAALSITLGVSGLFGYASQALADSQVIYRNGSHAAVSAPQTKAMPGVTVVADGSSLQIGRVSPGGTKPAQVDQGWTIYVYLCGSDLETNSGLASVNLEQMVGASASNKIRYVVECGGSESWAYEGVDASKLERLVIADGAVTKAESQPIKDMGDASTLEDFLTWGMRSYPSEHMGVILWDHGGGAVGGVCFDERSDDGLSLAKLDSALRNTFSHAWKKFDFIGFDACLMSTIEVANVCATYADYLYASQEVEPGTGWDYDAIGEFLAKNPNADGAALGRIVADSYVARSDDMDSATFAVTRLSAVDDLLRKFYTVMSELYDKTGSSDALADFVRNVLRVDNFGGNNKSEGYTNMIDLAGLNAVAAPFAPSSAAFAQALKDAVVYEKDNAAHPSVGGLSIYYPLEIPDSDTLQVFEQVAINPAYVAFVDRLAHGSVFGSIDDYDGSTWTGVTKGGQASYWDYVDGGTGESKLITFAEKPHLDADGTYCFRLSKAATDAAVSVSALVYMPSDDGADDIALGETFDVDVNWETGEVADEFDGLWLSLPDGQNLCAYPCDWTDDYVVYSCPVKLNDEEVYLRVRVYDDGHTSVEGTWDGIDESGAVDRGCRALKPGDKIVPLYDSFDADDGDAPINENSYVGSVCVVDDKFEIAYDWMFDSDFYYSFYIEDLYGNYYVTDAVTFKVDDQGNVFFYE